VLHWFQKRIKPAINPLKVDIHSHLLPGLDDGVKSFEESLTIIQYFQDLGYTRLITTPHVMADAYRNTSASILEKCKDLQSFLLGKKINLEIAAAAEYYLDEGLLNKLEQDEPLLTFGENYLLFETNFLNEPLNLRDFIFIATTKGYKPVLAHPERYLYLHNNLDKAEDLLDRGVLFQINISSLTGYYSHEAQRMAGKLIERGWIHWLGSDCHHLQHAKLINDAYRNKYFKKAITLPLLNNTLQ
jgi:protein-tyrosine phosphatase